MKTTRLFSLFVFLITSGSILAQADNDPVLMTINGNPIKKSEFEYIYNKNNSTNTLDKKTLDEYVDLFINFKLKVEEAKAHGIDTTAAFVKEYSGYRTQLVKPYFTDKEAEEAIVKEAYNRMKEDVEISHILVRLRQDATAADTLAAYKEIEAIQKRLKKEDFAKVVKEISDQKEEGVSGGYLGWITGFVYFYPFETVAYNTPAGQTSPIFRTQTGYHIIKVHNRRPAQGEVLTSHIMVFNGETKEQQKAAKQKIDSLYQLVLNGADFGTVAKENSEDTGSAMRNGEIPWFSSGRMVVEYENAAFALDTIGQISKPISSPYGWHIIKLLGKRGVPSFEEARPDIERKVKQDDRSTVGKDAFIAKLKKEYNFQINENNVKEFSDLLEGKSLSDSVYQEEISKLNKPLFSFADKQYSQADFASYLKANPYTLKTIPSEVIKQKIDLMVSKELQNYEDSQLENKYDDLRFLAQEYYDGILLFEISNQEVWEKASKDTEGLTKFFNEHKEDYTWEEPYFKGYVIEAKDKKTLKEAKSIIKKAPADSIRKFLRELNDSVQYIRVESKTLFKKGDNKLVDEKIFGSKEKQIPTKEFPYVYVAGKKLNAPESYKDVPGPVTADYQSYLEKEWITYLRNKYPVTINEEVLKTVKKN